MCALILPLLLQLAFLQRRSVLLELARHQPPLLQRDNKVRMKMNNQASIQKKLRIWGEESLNFHELSLKPLANELSGMR